MAVPDWVSDAVFYQIFPDRFANGDPGNDPPNVRPWGTKPDKWGFQGGDLRGVTQHIDYLLDLGVNAIYFNPIFMATSNHRYNTTDYFRIDPKLGGMRDFKELLDRAHQHGIRVILDGVFNHCGRGFFAFNDLLENGVHSPYRDWFHVRRFPLRAYSPGRAEDYLGWWGLKELPKFNTDNPEVRRYLLEVARHWVDQGIDGWRLDVPNEIDDDGFWAEFRRVVKEVNPDAYLVGEIWEVDPRWVGDGHFDGLLNYPFRDMLLRFLAKGTLSAEAFADGVEGLISAYPTQHVLSHYLPLGTHDTERVRTVCDGEVSLVKLAFLFQFCYPGVPGIYYGDEIGLEGGRDPDCRGGFPWDEALWDRGLRAFVRELVHLRRRLPQLRRGDFLRLIAEEGSGVCAFGRRGEGQAAVVALNVSDATRHVTIPVRDLGWADGREVESAFDRQSLAVSHDMLELDLPPREGVLLHA